MKNTISTGLFIGPPREVNGYDRAWDVYATVGAAREKVATFKREGDALLYVSAPDLLAALEKAHGLLSDLESDIHEAGKDCPNLYNADFIPGVRNTLLAAIAKAKGEE